MTIVDAGAPDDATAVPERKRERVLLRFWNPLGKTGFQSVILTNSLPIGVRLMTNPLKGFKIAVLAVSGFEQAELTEPKRELTEAGAEVNVISADPGTIQGFNNLDKDEAVEVDATFDHARHQDYDAVLIPGAVAGNDRICMIPRARAFVLAADRAHKPVAVTGHGASLLISAGIVKGHVMTSCPSLRDDIRNAGGRWVEAGVVEDGNLISCSKPEALAELSRKLIAQLWMCGEPR